MTPAPAPMGFHPGDPDRLARLHAASFTMPRPWTATEIAETLAGPGAFLIEAAAGFLIGRALAGEAELLTLAVAPEARRQGIGGRLVAAFLRDGAARRAERAFLEVAMDNEAAQALYLRAGFAEAGRRRNYYAAPGGGRIDALVMTRPIEGVAG